MKARIKTRSHVVKGLKEDELETKVVMDRRLPVQLKLVIWMRRIM